MMRILLADDQPEVRSALRLILDQDGNPWQVCGEVADAKGVLEEVGEKRCDMVLLDWELPGLHPGSGKDLVRADGRVLSALRILHPHILLVALSGRAEARYESTLAGVDVFISKGDPPEKLLETLHGLVRQAKTSSHDRVSPS
jgi:DNA-binding NarL/FixJ family response regulator